MKQSNTMPNSMKKIKHDLDGKVSKLYNMKNLCSDKDIPRWLSALILVSFCITTITYIYYENPSYLTSDTGYPNGQHIYLQINEAIKLKELIKNGTTNFWSSETSLGYAMFQDSPPLPCFVTAFMMLLFERFLSPLHMVRCIIVSLMGLLPFTMYLGSRWMMLSRTQSIIVALFSLSIDSQVATGMELDAYLLHGLFSHLFAIVLFPLCVSKSYRYGFHIRKNKNELSPLYILCLVYLCSKPVGLYCSMLSFVTLFVRCLLKSFRKDYVKDSLNRFLRVHVGVMLYLSWWLIPLAISYPYISYNQKYNLSFTCITDYYTNGKFFDFRHQVMFFTVLTAVGACVMMKNVWKLSKSLRYMNHQRIYSIWLLIAVIFTVFLFIAGPVVQQALFDFGLDRTTQLVGLHYCGLLLVAYAIKGIIDAVLYLSLNSSFQKGIRFLLIVFISCWMIKSSSKRISERVSLIEVPNDFKKSLYELKRDFPDGRIVTHQKLGTGGAWDMNNIPYLTGKPGLLTNQHASGSLSDFYLQSMTNNDITAEEFHNLLRLYNTHYLAVSSVYLQSLNVDHLKHISTIDDVQFYEIDPDEYESAYFDIVRLPGYMDGNLKNVRESVVESLALYSSNVLLYLNPRRSSDIREKSIINVQVLSLSLRKEIKSSDIGVSVVNWKFKGQDIDSTEAIHSMQQVYFNKPIKSQVVEEIHLSTEYHAVIDIRQDGSNEVYNIEHLLLKVSYHPFWRASYFPVDRSYTLDRYDSTFVTRNRTLLTVHHVTPNLMAVLLPCGRYHVIFRYRFPGILKILALICAIVFINKFLKLRLEFHTRFFIIRVKNVILRPLVFLSRAGITGSVKLYYSLMDFIIPYSVKRVFSYVTAPVLTLKKKCSELRVRCTSSLKDLTILRKSFDTLSNRQLAARQYAMNILKTPQVENPCVVKYKEITQAAKQKNHFDVLEEMIGAPQHGKKLSLSNWQNEKSFSDPDSSFTNENYLCKASPPTPPKHKKKSIRKKQTKVSSNSDDVFTTPIKETNELFQTASTRPDSPVLGNILKALRRNSQSPPMAGTKIPPVSSSPERRQTLVLGFDSQKVSLSRPSTLPLANKYKSSAETYRRDTLVPMQNSNSSMTENNFSSKVNQNTIANHRNYPTSSPTATLAYSDMFAGASFSSYANDEDSDEHYGQRKMTLIPNNDSFISDYLPTQSRSSEANGLLFGSSEEIDIESYTGLLSDQGGMNEGDIKKKGFSDSHMIDVNRLVLQDANHPKEMQESPREVSLDDDSFSPEHSSSPDLSHSSLEQFSSSPDTGSSSDSSFEYKSCSTGSKISEYSNKEETVVKTDLYRLNLPDVEAASVLTKHRNTVYFDDISSGNVQKPQGVQFIRRATIASDQNNKSSKSKSTDVSNVSY